MTLTEAQAALRPPLVFGDSRQIEATQFLETVTACAIAIKACRHSAGKTGICYECMEPFEFDVIRAALAVLRAEEKA